MCLKCSLQRFRFDFRQETRVSFLGCVKQHYFHSWFVQEEIYILLSDLSIYFLPYYDTGLNTKHFVYLDFGKYRLGLHRNTQVLTKCSSCISAIQWFYMGRVKRICVFEHSVMTNFNCACPAIQRGQGSGFLSEGSS